MDLDKDGLGSGLTRFKKGKGLNNCRLYIMMDVFQVPRKRWTRIQTGIEVCARIKVDRISENYL
jgi:hypothetical protein